MILRVPLCHPRAQQRWLCIGLANYKPRPIAKIADMKAKAASILDFLAGSTSLLRAN